MAIKLPLKLRMSNSFGFRIALRISNRKIWVVKAPKESSKQLICFQNKQTGGNMKLSLLAIGAVLALSTSALAQNVIIRGVRLSGSGCGSAASNASITDDGQTLSLLFDNYGIEIGQGSANPQATSLQKDCRVLIDVDVKAGVQYALQQTDYRGFAAVPASAVAMHRFTQVIPNQPVASMREATINGPQSGDYAVSVKQKPGRLIYSTCNAKSQTIELLSTLSVQYLRGTTDRTIAMINLDSVDTGLASSFQLSWRPCR